MPDTTTVAKKKKGVQYNTVEEAESDLRKVEVEQQIKRTKRRGLFRAVDDYLGYASSKLVSVGAFAVGGLETLAPNLLDIQFLDPTTVFGVGFGMLAGKKVIDGVAKLKEVLDKND